jgi:hypothetical protein
LLLWAAYSEHENLTRPEECIEKWSEDEAFRLSTSSNFKTNYPSLLRDTEIWLPSRFRFTFAAPNASGKTVNFGSVYSLRDELTALNERTWNADEAAISRWRLEGAAYRSPMEVGAKFAFSIFHALTQAAIDHRLVMLLDW